MGCNGLLASLASVGGCGLVLLGVTAYRLILFMVFISVSIGPSVLFTIVYNNLTGLDPLPRVVEPMICMLLIRCWAEFAVGIEPRVCGTTLNSYKFRYPNTMTVGRFTVNMCLYFAAFCQLYIQFEACHSFSPSTRLRRRGVGSNVSEESQLSAYEKGSAKAKDWHSALFLISLSYLVFTTTMTFHKNVLHVVENLPAPYSILSNCMIRVGYAVIHLTVNLVYFLPCFAIAYTSRAYKTDGFAMFFQLACTATMSGMIAALFEMNKPWPRHRGQMPLLHFENNLIAKDKISMALVCMILLSYYRPFKHRKIAANAFDSSHQDLLNFCMSVAFTVLHVVKYGVHAVLTLAQDYDAGRDLELLHIPPPQLPDLLPDNEGSDSEESLSPETGQDLEHGQLCQRCANNALNNNNAVEMPNMNPSNNNEPSPLNDNESELDSELGPEVVVAGSHNQPKTGINDKVCGEEQVGTHSVVEISNIVDTAEVDIKHSQSYIV